jgi:hypothetical protein
MPFDARLADGNCVHAVLRDSGITRHVHFISDGVGSRRCHGQLGGPAVMLLSGSRRVVSLCASAVGLVQMMCRECAAEVAVTARVCSGCGLRLLGSRRWSCSARLKRRVSSVPFV